MEGFLITDIQTAFPFRKTGFFNNLRIVLIPRSAKLGPLSVNLEYCCLFFNFYKFLKNTIINICSSIIFKIEW